MARLATPETGLEAQVRQYSTLLLETLQTAGDPGLIILYRQMQSFEKDYWLTRQRPLMQSAFNTARPLREAIELGSTLEADQKARALTYLDNYLATAEEILELDVAIRSRFNEFDLQAEAIDPISAELIVLANEEVERARTRIEQTRQVETGILVAITVVGLALVSIIGRVLNNSITRNVVELTQVAGEFQAGNLEVRAQIDSADEIGQLGDSFNTMATRLNSLVGGLEQRVAERTAALTTANEQLQQEIIERKQAEEKLEQRATQLTLLNDIGGQIAAVLDLDRVLEKTTRLVQESFDYHHVALFTIDREQGELAMRARTGAFTDFFPLDYRIKLDAGMNGWVARHGQRILANDVNVEPRYVNFFPDLIPTQSELSVPIQVGQETIGVLDIQSLQLNAFDENDVLVIETLAGQIAVAIENARLYEAVRQELAERKRAEEALKEYSERLEEMVDARTQALRDAQEQLVRKEKLATLGQLAGSVAHELRNPLGVLSNAVYYLEMVLTDVDETTREYLGMIASEVRKSEKIVSDLLNFSRTRLDEGAEREPVEVAVLVAQVLAEQPPPEQVEVSTQIAPDLPLVFVDPQQMGQVLTNLVTNAYQAMPDGGRLTIAAEVSGDQSPISNSQSPITISITDTGSGISPENMAKLFEPLFTSRAKGIGLGLAVSKSLVEANGGSIEVESKEGEGSTFTITLPTEEVEK